MRRVIWEYCNHMNTSVQRLHAAKPLPQIFLHCPLPISLWAGPSQEEPRTVGWLEQGPLGGLGVWVQIPALPLTRGMGSHLPSQPQLSHLSNGDKWHHWSWCEADLLLVQIVERNRTQTLFSTLPGKEIERPTSWIHVLRSQSWPGAEQDLFPLHDTVSVECFFTFWK